MAGEKYLDWAREQLPDTQAELIGERLAREAVGLDAQPPQMTAMGTLEDLAARSAQRQDAFSPGGYRTPSSFDLERAKVLHALAAERLALADKYAAIRKETHVSRSESKSDYDPMKRLGLMASTGATSDTAEVEEAKLRSAARTTAEKEFGARAFNYVSPDGKREELWAARPGTPEKEVQTLKDNAASLSVIDKLIKEIDDARSLKDKVRENAIVTANVKALAGVLGGSLFNSGVVNPSELEDMKKIANQQGIIGPDGIEAFRKLRGTLRVRYENQLRQAGATKVSR
jgi:hypothetical protein